MMMLKKVPSKTDLLRAVIRREDHRRKAVTKMEREIQALYDKYQLRVAKFLKSKAFATKTDVINLQSATKAMSQLTTILVQAGYEDTISTFLDEFEGLTKEAAKYFAEFGEPQVEALSGIDVESLQAYSNFQRTELAKSINRSLVDPIQSALLQANMGNMTRETLVENILTLEPSTRAADVLVDDAFAQYQRAIIVQKGQNLDLQIYQYLGPSDDITSDQCQAMLEANKHGVPGMLYEDEITVDLHPNLVMNPLIAGGHPRCRHHWSPVTEGYAESLGFKLRTEEGEE